MKSTRRLNSVGEMLKNAIYSALFGRTKKKYEKKKSNNTIIRYSIKNSLRALRKFVCALWDIREKLEGKNHFSMGKMYKKKSNLSNTFFLIKNVFVNLVKELIFVVWKVKSLKFWIQYKNLYAISCEWNNLASCSKNKYKTENESRKQ